MTFDDASHLIKRGNIIALRKALDSGLDPNTSHRFGATLLMVSASTGTTSIGRLLIERGAHLDARDTHRKTALSDAIMSGHVDFVRLLLEHGASLDCDSDGVPINVFLNWYERYTRATPEQIRKVRALVDAEKSRRDQERVKPKILDPEDSRGSSDAFEAT